MDGILTPSKDGCGYRGALSGYTLMVQNQPPWTVWIVTFDGVGYCGGQKLHKWFKGESMQDVAAKARAWIEANPLRNSTS